MATRKTKVPKGEPGDAVLLHECPICHGRQIVALTYHIREEHPESPQERAMRALDLKGKK